jgi:5'-phosphate synthase pdxT subunit
LLNTERRLRIGLLALQGDFAEHAEVLRELGVEPVEVRRPEQLEGLDGLIIPGGESTTIGKLLDDFGLTAPLRERTARGWPVWGTCAGAILLADDIEHSRQPRIGGMDISVQRNAFGRQVQSFEADLDVPALGRQPFRAVFIRAPVIDRVGARAQDLARLEDGRIVAARQGHLLATCFHPELTKDHRFHRYFIEEVVGSTIAA